MFFFLEIFREKTDEELSPRKAFEKCHYKSTGNNEKYSTLSEEAKISCQAKKCFKLFNSNTALSVGCKAGKGEENIF